MAIGNGLQMGDKLSQYQIRYTPSPIPKFLAFHHDIPRLDDLTADHMSQAQQVKFGALLATVRQWRNEWTEGRSLVLASPRFGIGKTHIAKALAASFDTLAIVDGTETALINGRPNWQIMKRSKVITARQYMDAIDKGQQVTSRNTRVLVLDDLGREGNIEYVAKDNQVAEIQSRYFELINYCNDMQISLIVTTNHRVSEIPSLIGEASWSRLQGMAPRGYILGAWRLSRYAGEGVGTMNAAQLINQDSDLQDHYTPQEIVDSASAARSAAQ